MSQRWSQVDEAVFVDPPGLRNRRFSQNFNFLPWMDQCNARLQHSVHADGSIPRHQHTFKYITSTLQPNTPANCDHFLCSLIYNANAEREKVTEREEYLQHGGFQTGDEEEALLMIR